MPVIDITSIRKKSEDFWIRQGERLALQRFHVAAKTIPAYRKFLQHNGVHHANIRTIADFKNLPETNKENYIQKFSLEERSPSGSFSSHRIIAISSGTTGMPTLWPRGSEQEKEAVAVHDLLFSDLYELHRYRTLLIICFPMGIYVSGIATAIPSFLVSLRHKNLTLLTAGNNKDVILDVLEKLPGQYQQIIFAGHPFFVKDILETGTRKGIEWSKTKVRTFFVSEGFSEKWRGYVGKALLQSAPEQNLFSMYGSSELLLMGYESPETILIRQASEANARLCRDLFHSSRTPSLFHYNPALRYIETNQNSELLFSAWSGIPLIRFNLHDTGEVISKKEMRQRLGPAYENLATHMDTIHWRPWNLPFVTLFGRSDYTLIFHAVNIYPDHVHMALNNPDFLKSITGKFLMEKKETVQENQTFIVHIELQATAKPTPVLRENLEKHLIKVLSKVNLEYNDASKHLGKVMHPRVVLHTFCDPHFFPLGLKPKYITSQ